VGRARHHDDSQDEDRPCLTDADLDAIADEIESTDHDGEALKIRREALRRFLELV
jgi:hypothetical protein